MRKNTLVLIFIFSLLTPLNIASAAATGPCFIDPSSPFCAPPTPDPIIIIPGIMGSWNWNVILRDKANNHEEWIFPPFSNTYQPLIDALRNEFTNQGLDPDKYVFTAFYDWRQPNVLAAQDYLKPIIEQAKQETGKEKVDLIAHSMGGILARSYIQDRHYDNDVDQLFMLGTPNYGSGDVYAPWNGGYVPQNWDNMQRVLFNLYFWFNKIFVQKDRYDFIHTKLLSIRDLLPTYDFIKDTPSDTLKPTNTMNEQNITLNALNNTIADLESLVGSVTTIAGDNQETVSEIPVIDPQADEDPLWKDGKPDPLDPDRNSSTGDNRVLLSSAHIQSMLDQVTLNDAKHADLPSKAGPELFLRLGFSDPGELALIEQPDKILSFMFASPVLPTITAPNGVISKDGSTIPGVIYFGEDDPKGLKMILIPNPQNGKYKVDLLGNGAGHYDFASAYFETNKPEILKTFSGEVTEGEQISYTANLDTESETPLKTELNDVNPPIITIKKPEDGKAYRNNGMMTVDFVVTDESVIENQESRFDNIDVANNQIIDLSLQKLGNHTFVAAATDKHGNEGHASSRFLTFVTPESLKNNINHYFTLGLIKNKGISSTLIAILDLYQKALNPKVKQMLKKSFEATVLVGKKSKLLTPQGADLLIEQAKAL